LTDLAERAIASSGGQLRVPRRAHIARVDPSDPLDFYYAPHTAWIFRWRLQLALDLLGPGPYESLLEAGYGSGILLPSLAARTHELHAMDLHRRTDLVAAMLRAEGVRATLAIGDVCSLPYADGAFDALVCVSTLEHLHGDELTAAVDGFQRVLRPNGIAVVGVPASGRLMEALFNVIGFHEIDDHHVSTRGDIERSLRRSFHVEAQAHLPGGLPEAAALYSVFRCRRH
jgi:SAM-dependent methyltransferase